MSGSFVPPLFVCSLVLHAAIDSFSASQSSIVVYKNAQRSFGDALSSAISGDLLLLFSGFALMMIYLCIALGMEIEFLNSVSRLVSVSFHILFFSFGSPTLPLSFFALSLFHSCIHG